MHLGLLLTSSYEYPGRYARWTVGFLSPPIQIEGKGLDFTISALNSRGKVILKIIEDHLLSYDKLFKLQLVDDSTLSGKVIPSSRYFNEEERSQQPSLFSLVRSIRELFSSEQLGQLGLYGAFGYDLAFQFEPIKLFKPRMDDQRDLLLYLPDEIIVVDKYRSDSWKVQFDFSKNGLSTRGLARSPCLSKFVPATASDEFESRDTPQSQYAKNVVAAKEQFRLGNLFEVVLRLVNTYYYMYVNE